MATPIQQLLSRSIFATDGTTTVWDFSFSGGYIDRTHIKAYVQDSLGNRTDLTINYDTQLIGPFQLQISPALADDNTLHIYRDTPKDLPLVNFVDGAANSEVSLDTNAKQAVFIAAETTDAFSLAPSDAEASATAAAASALAASNSAASVSFMRNLHRGFNISVTSTVLSVGEGQASDNSSSVIIDLAATMTKSLGAWVAGSGNGGLASGTIAANTWYYIHVIRRTDTGQVDVLFSTSAVSPVMPANYTQRRLVGAWRTDASALWEPWLMTGDVVTYNTARPLTGSPTTVRSNRTATLPFLTVRAHLAGKFTSSASGDCAVVFTDTGQANLVPDAANSLGQVLIPQPSTTWQGVLPPVRVSSGEVGDRAVNLSTGTYSVIGFDLGPTKGR